MPYADLTVRRECNRLKNLVYRKTEKYRIKAKLDSTSPKKRIRQSAGRAVSRAIRSGKMKRMPCEICNGVAEAHHDSYREEDRLKVKWLCKLHHEEWHMKNKPLYPI